MIRSVAYTKHAIELVALADHSRVSVAVPKYTLKGVAEPGHASTTVLAYANDTGAADVVVSGDACCCVLMADAEHAIKVIALADNTRIVSTLAEHSLKGVTFSDNASSSFSDYAISGLIDSLYTEPTPFIVCAENSGAIWIVANTKYAVQLIALADNTRIVSTLAEHSLKRVTFSDNASSSFSDYAISPACIFC
jgi:hypothetical protein